jgi:tRNA(fMet)-specific endonuclease VapC
VILDTNVLSAVAEGRPEARSALQAASVLALPVIVLGEYRFGISQSTRRHEYEQFLAQLVLMSNVLEVTHETTRWYAGVRLDLKRAGTPIPANDVWIAALCRQHGLPILSRDLHFDVVPGLQRITW